MSATIPPKGRRPPRGGTPSRVPARPAAPVPQQRRPPRAASAPAADDEVLLPAAVTDGSAASGRADGGPDGSAAAATGAEAPAPTDLPGETADAAPVEVELKLALSAESMEVLLASPLLRAHARGPVREGALRGVYYDTADRRLLARGAALRVREVDGGRRRVQTLKTAKRADTPHAHRFEWEVELAGPGPRPDAFADPAALAVAGPLAAGDLLPVFETRVRRRLLTVDWPDPGDPAGRPAEVEVSFDDGVVAAADGGVLPISELELELLRGDARALYGLALALRGLVPLRIEPRDKATRGWLLATGARPPAVRAAPVPLDCRMTVDDALAATLGAALRHWLDNEPAAAAGHQPEGLHQLRVALRRLRSALTIFKGALAPGDRERWGGELRWLLGPLGPARDLDVLTTGLLPPLLLPGQGNEGGGGDPALLAFAAVAERRREAAQAAVRDVLASQRYADLALELAAWVERRGWREGAAPADEAVRRRQGEGIEAFARRVLKKRHRAVERRGRGFAGLDPEARHELRIALKKLRYGTDFLAGLFPGKRLDRHRKAVARMQDRLGHLNDVAVASRLVHELVDPLRAGARAKVVALGGGRLVGWYARQVADQEPATVAAWDKVARLKPFWREKAAS